jgi:hypothetical protein
MAVSMVAERLKSVSTPPDILLSKIWVQSKKYYMGTGVAGTNARTSRRVRVPLSALIFFISASSNMMTIVD